MLDDVERIDNLDRLARLVQRLLCFAEQGGKNHRRCPHAWRDGREHQGRDEGLTPQLRDEGDRSPLEGDRPRVHRNKVDIAPLSEFYFVSSANGLFAAPG
jgi:hypothetical protein